MRKGKPAEPRERDPAEVAAAAAVSARIAPVKLIEAFAEDAHHRAVQALQRARHDLEAARSLAGSVSPELGKAAAEMTAELSDFLHTTEDAIYGVRDRMRSEVTRRLAASAGFES